MLENSALFASISYTSQANYYISAYWQAKRRQNTMPFTFLVSQTWPSALLTLPFLSFGLWGAWTALILFGEA